MFDVLMFIFENYIEGRTEIAVDQETVVAELEQAGFSPMEIGRAFEWLDGLVRLKEMVEAAPKLKEGTIRHFSQEESKVFSVEAKGFLLYLEQLGILDPLTREVVIDRVMALGAPHVDLGRIKWVILIALFSQPTKKSALFLLQAMFLTDNFEVLH